MTDSPYIHHSLTLRRLLGTVGGFPDLEHHQQVEQRRAARPRRRTAPTG